MSPPSGSSSHLPPHLTLQHFAESMFEVPESYSKFLLAIYFTYGIVNFFVTFSIHLPFSLLSSHSVHRSVLFVCFSIAALKINSSVPSLQIPYICASIQHLYSPFWLTSLCIIGSSFIHLIRTDSNLFVFMAEYWRRKWQPTPVFLPRESQRQGSLVGCRLWGRRESDMTEVT